MIILIIVSFYPQIFTSNDPLFEESPKFIEYRENGVWVEKFAYNPMRPNKENIMGTDDAGRDIYSRLLYGTKNTLKLGFFIALFRFLLALPLGLIAGMGSGTVSRLIKVFSTFFTAIPMLVFCFIVLNIGYFRSLQMDRSIIAFSIVLAFAGWSKTAVYLEAATKRVLDEPFIEGEKAIGKSKLQIMYQNVLPHLIPESISLFFKEIGMALFLVAQLAFLYVFVGVTRPIKALAFIANYDMILEPEWGGTLSRIAVDLKRYQRVYWITFYPILVFSFAILGINLMGEGLKIEFQKRDSKIVNYIRKAFLLASPRIYISQLLRIHKYYIPVLLKTLTAICIIAAFTINWHPSRYKFDSDISLAHLLELTDDKYEGRVAGSSGGYMAGEYIIKEMRSYGYIIETTDIPVVSDSPNKPAILCPVIITSGQITLTDAEGNTKMFDLHKDFSVLSIDEDMIDIDKKAAISYEGFAADSANVNSIPHGESAFFIDRNFSGLQVLMYNMPGQRFIGADHKVQFILLDAYERRHNTYVFKSTTIIPFHEMRKMLEEGFVHAKISFSYPKIPDNPGRNISATLPGANKTVEKPGEVIIIGGSYDGVYSKSQNDPFVMTAAPAATMLEIARVISNIDTPLDKTVRFIFWDNEFENIIYSPFSGSYHYGMTDKTPILMANTHGYYYFDISYPGLRRDKYLNLVSYPAQRADKSNYLLGMEIEKRLKAMNIKYLRFRFNLMLTSALRHMRLNALTSVGIGNNTSEINTPIDTIHNMDFERFTSVGQAIVDALTMNPYIME